MNVEECDATGGANKAKAGNKIKKTQTFLIASFVMNECYDRYRVPLPEVADVTAMLGFFGNHGISGTSTF
ncbi:MAG TPA: hypothetical protein VGB71_11840, partial [Flavisolibacter sp.]